MYNRGPEDIDDLDDNELEPNDPFFD